MENVVFFLLLFRRDAVNKVPASFPSEVEGSARPAPT